MTTKEKIAVMQAFEDGKKVRWRGVSSTYWYEAKDPVWDWDTKVYEVIEEPKATFNSFSDVIGHFEGCKLVVEKGGYILVSNQKICRSRANPLSSKRRWWLRIHRHLQKRVRRVRS